ncbi:Hemerythrin HHE cation binding domain-containing protein [Amphritea atlantica]|uniref:Hemerythrin HHE cation binding domain-containing protein n=1 Tax=Amphritea atlantica TaxID=355243 RepID=A0A1H9I7D8_9GAMM|nr:hemerythrin domain-containing protein [Amphritea atlantica]SEQ70479.1 Hemerythrin HHE cation binding domain-containing protein [Amphritea atlantica]
MNTKPSSPTDDFSQCHISIIKNFEQLGKLGNSEITDPVQPETSQVAQKLITFFHEVVLNHHQEEEQELFNIVMDCASPGEELQQTSMMVKRLTEEHRNLEKEWKKIEPDLKKLAKGRFVELDRQAATGMSEHYLLHAKYEESFFLPLSAEILKNTDLESLGLSLHTRHNLHKTPGYI